MKITFFTNCVFFFAGNNFGLIPYPSIIFQLGSVPSIHPNGRGLEIAQTLEQGEA